MAKESAEKFVLVYQVGIANLFSVDAFNLSDYGREARRVYQGDFKTAAAMARGIALGGAKVGTAHCDMAGDIARQRWEFGAGALWGEHKSEVWSGVNSEEYIAIGGNQ